MLLTHTPQMILKRFEEGPREHSDTVFLIFAPTAQSFNHAVMGPRCRLNKKQSQW